ncbi:MAG TPA: hypothetical protein VFM60_02010 [Salinimicrobium sp.]|nr:hypothetical protein [Salinimicrobium sp.]
MVKLSFLVLIIGLSAFIGCKGKGESDSGISVNSKNLTEDWIALEVTASAYNSLKGQGSGNANITAWGDTLKPGMKVIAVSRDLINKGLTPGTPVKIEGLNGIYTVADKMNARWRNKIDIYMGMDKDRALEWGRKKLIICFPVRSTKDKMEYSEKSQTQ